MDYKIIIPSYNREGVLVNKTMKILGKHNINPKKVYIFVANEEEKKKYQNVLPNNFKDRLIVGVKGMKNIRNFINDYFNEGDKLFHMDDDIIDLYYRVNEKQLEPIKNLDEFIKIGFSLCEKKGCNLFSIYPVENPYFMKNTIFRGLTYCMGGIWGNINRKELKVTVDNKEDFERSIQYYIDSFKKGEVPLSNKSNLQDISKGGVIRFNNICCGTKGYSGSGGMQSFDRSNDIILKQSKKIVEKYGDFCSLNLKKKSGKPEIKIRQIKLEEIHLD